MTTQFQQDPPDAAAAPGTDADVAALPDTEHFQTPVPDPADLFEVSFTPEDTAEPEATDDPAPADPLPAAPLPMAAFAAVVAAPDPDRFPGRRTFRLGNSDPAVTRLGTMLISRGGKRFYAVGAGPTFGVADRNAGAAFQRAQGWTGSNADGYPGPRTWELLVSGKGHDIPAGTRTLKSPVPGFRPTYAFGVKDHRYAAGFHTGCDYAAPNGSAIVAVVSGKVVRADWGGAYGNWTQIAGQDGHVWMYAHQSRRTVKVGQHVAAGQVIGYVGSTGNVTGPHLHLEKSRDRRWAYARVVNPKW